MTFSAEIIGGILDVAKFKKLSKDALAQIQALLRGYLPRGATSQPYKKIIAEIERTGEISDQTLGSFGIFNQGTIRGLRSNIADISGGYEPDSVQQTQVETPITPPIVPPPISTEPKPKTQAELKAEVGGADQAVKTVDEAGLTDEELSRRRDAYKELGETKGDIQRETIVNTLKTKLKSYGVTANVDALANQITDKAIEFGRYPNAQELKDAFSKDTIFSH